MRKTRIISLAAAAALVMSLASGCANTEPDAVVDPANTDAAVLAASEVKPSPADIDRSGIQGLVVRANSDEVNAARFNGTTVTDLVLTLGANDASAVISDVKTAGINVYVEVDAVPAGDAVVSSVKSVLDKYDVNGIELDFVVPGVAEATAKDAYDLIAVTDKLVADAAAAIAGYETTYGHPIALSVKVATDLITNYNFGCDVMSWVADGYVDMVCPATGSEITSSNIPTRLWYSLLQPFGVKLAPCMEANIKTYPDTKLAVAQNDATLAGQAAAMISMGADKVCVAYSTASDASLKVLGSYNALMATDRSSVLTYTELTALWQVSDEQLPQSIANGKNATVRIPMGDVAEGSTVLIKLGLKPGTTGITGPAALSGATVYANSKPCTFSHEEPCALGYTDANLFCFTVPAEVLGEGHIVAEVLGAKGSLTLYSAEIFVDAK